MRKAIIILSLAFLLISVVILATDTIPASQHEMRQLSVKDYDKLKNCATDISKHPTSIEYLTFFNCGHVKIGSDGKTIRDFTLIIRENVSIPISYDGHTFDAWTFNGTVPGPTMRMTEGDNVRITVINDKNNKFAHTLHMHSIHPGSMDGVDNPILPGSNFTYEFVADPYGVYPYHCHVDPIADHINRGLYGAMIIDPKTPRENMTEMIMLMNGYDLDFDQEGPTLIRPVQQQHLQQEQTDRHQVSIWGHSHTSSSPIEDADNDNKDNSNNQTDNQSEDVMETSADSETRIVADNENGKELDGDAKAAAKEGEGTEANAERDNEIYTVNGKAFDYMHHPVNITTNEKVRLYLVNMLEFDLVNSFHLHGSMFNYIPSGTSETPSYLNDIIVMGQGDRGILEFTYKYPGRYMFHAHVTEFTDLGWMGLFNVTDGKVKQDSG